MSDQVVALSNAALAIRTGCFLAPFAHVRIENKVSRLTPKARAAIKELIEAGCMTEEIDGDARVYRLTAAGALLRRKSLKWMAQHGNFSLVERIS